MNDAETAEPMSSEPDAAADAEIQDVGPADAETQDADERDSDGESADAGDAKAPSPDCDPLCGDSIVCGEEECDDGNRNNFDSCLADCRVSAMAEQGDECSPIAPARQHAAIAPRAAAEPAVPQFGDPVVTNLPVSAFIEGGAEYVLVDFASVDASPGLDLLMWMSSGTGYKRRGISASNAGDGTFAEPKLGWKEDGRWYYVARPYHFNLDGMFDSLNWIEVPYRPQSQAISAIGLGGHGRDGEYFEFVEWKPRAPLDGSSDLDILRGATAGPFGSV